MKKTLISAVILTALLTTGCQDKELQNKILEQDKVINQLMAEKKNLQEELFAAKTKAEQAIPAIFTQPEVIFQKSQNLKANADAIRDDLSIDYDYSTLKTGIDWLDELILNKMFSIPGSKINKQKIIESIENKFNQEIKESEGFGSFAEFMKINFIGQRENIATFELYSYSYSGGAHGLQNSKFFNVDLKNHRVLSLSDIFAEQDLPKVEKLLWQAFLSEKPYDPNNEDIEDGSIGASDSFYFRDGIMHFVYPPYEIGAYAEGIKELKLSDDKLKELFKPEFKALMRFE